MMEWHCKCGEITEDWEMRLYGLECKCMNCGNVIESAVEYYKNNKEEEEEDGE